MKKRNRFSGVNLALEVLPTPKSIKLHLHWNLVKSRVEVLKLWKESVQKQLPVTLEWNRKRPIKRLARLCEESLNESKLVHLTTSQHMLGHLM